MGFLIGFLTFVMIVDCLLLILLVIVQLPKKEAGAGIAFGGGTADALFGAGSGNVLTKITKYAIGILFGMAIVLSVLQSHYTHAPTSEFERAVENPTATAPVPRPATPPAESVPAAAATANTTNLLLAIPMTNTPAGE